MKPGPMAWSSYRAAIHGILLITCHDHCHPASLSFICSCLPEPPRPVLPNRTPPTIKSDHKSNLTTAQESHYIKNTSLRSNLTENQTGLPLSIQITVQDTDSCAPVENALVEIWGQPHARPITYCIIAVVPLNQSCLSLSNPPSFRSSGSNTHGAYSGEPSASTNSQTDCSSWLRGGLATDSDGAAKFETIYPGPEPKRAPRLYTTTLAVKNEADPSFKADSGSWKAQTEPYVPGTSIRAHVTISLSMNAPPKIEIGSSPSQCIPGSNTPPGDSRTTQPPQDNQSSSAPSSQSPIVAILMINLMLFYSMYGHGTFSNNDNGERQKCLI
ncbi:hypothetical protein PSTT_09888 [Puccinia striiformis]|uniref:Intradiol ring-cleavage dioxygenases domain-containing protein n=1 Tax=Puccinia striiformis TaxID=27350 RepID=A0A2S4V6J4_9BASI|nr:hypothetical protein PSTT_09888 [Puccinia striiformis]